MAREVVLLRPLLLLVVVVAAAAAAGVGGDGGEAAVREAARAAARNASLSVDARFEAFQVAYARRYATAEEAAYRRAVFEVALERHARLNADAARAGSSARFGVNNLADLTPAEFERRYLHDMRAPAAPSVARGARPAAAAASVPESFDWRTAAGVVQPVINAVQNQLSCGGCWAFSAVETVESMAAIVGHHAVQPLSYQQVISCSHNGYNAGCKGGLPKDALTYINSTGLETYAEYPFSDGKGTTSPCKFDGSRIVFKPEQIDAVVALSDSDNMTSTYMRQWLSQTGPLTVTVDARTWQDYINGIIQHNCAHVPDHAVQVTGYNLGGTPPYWIVRNSWGEAWGMDGYVLIASDVNMCNIEKDVVGCTLTRAA